MPSASTFLHSPFFWLLAFFTLLFCLQYFVLFIRVLRRRPAEFNPSFQPSVSVIICAHNEEENLKLFLADILNQDYPNFEVIVVNDQSLDDSQLLLRQWETQYPHLRHVQISPALNTFPGKKLAITLGIKATKNDIILLTDADCYPASDQWIANMVQPFQKEATKIVLGVSPLRSPNHRTAIAAIASFDAVWTAMQYVGLAMLRRPYMGVGRNLAYRRSFFFEKKGFAAALQIHSGDDDLFVSAHATRSNTSVVTLPEAFTFSKPKATWVDWQRQKSRHLSAGVFYKPATRFLLAGLWFIWLLYFISLALAIILISDWGIWLGLAAFILAKATSFFVHLAIYKRFSIPYLSKTLIWIPATYLLIIYPFLALKKWLVGHNSHW